jgi:hypothetical protein
LNVCIDLKRIQIDVNEVAMMNDSSPVTLKVFMSEELRRMGKLCRRMAGPGEFHFCSLFVKVIVKDNDQYGRVILWPSRCPQAMYLKSVRLRLCKAN